MKKELLAIISVLIVSFMLVACGQTAVQPEEKPDDTPVMISQETVGSDPETHVTISQEAVDSGLDAIDVMIDYISSKISKDEASEQLRALQAKINDETSAVHGFINIFLVGIEFNYSRDDIIEDIHQLEDYLAEYTPN